MTTVIIIVKTTTVNNLKYVLFVLCSIPRAQCDETHGPSVPTPTGLVCQNPKAQCTETPGPRFLNFDNFARFWTFFAYILCANFSDSKFCVCYFVSFFHICVIFHIHKVNEVNRRRKNVP